VRGSDQVVLKAAEHRGSPWAHAQSGVGITAGGLAVSPVLPAFAFGHRKFFAKVPSWDINKNCAASPPWSPPLIRRGHSHSRVFGGVGDRTAACGEAALDHQITISLTSCRQFEVASSG